MGPTLVDAIPLHLVALPVHTTTTNIKKQTPRIEGMFISMGTFVQPLL